MTQLDAADLAVSVVQIVLHAIRFLGVGIGIYLVWLSRQIRRRAMAQACAQKLLGETKPAPQRVPFTWTFKVPP